MGIKKKSKIALLVAASAALIVTLVNDKNRQENENN